MVFPFLSGYVLNGYISTYIITLILPLGPQILKYLLSGPFRKHLPALHLGNDVTGIAPNLDDKRYSDPFVPFF